MKKIISALLVFVMLLGCVFTLASCGDKPEMDLEKAKKNLEDAEYNVSYDDDNDSSPEIEKSLYAYHDEDEISITVYNDTKSARLAYDRSKMEKEFGVQAIEQQIKLMEHYLDEYKDDLSSEEIDEFEDTIKECKKQLEDADNYIIGRSGKTVWEGTKTAIEASKGK